MKIFKSIDELIGNTPLLELKGIEKHENLCARLLAKVEFFNPTGSAKDRPALEMLNKAEQDGILKKSTVIIEPTSGNTGIGIAAVGAARGYRVIIVMPDTMSIERILLMKAYGAEVVLTDGSLGMTGSIAEAKRLAAEYGDAFIPSQFDNPANPVSHYKTTGPEIWRDTDGKVDFFVAGIGTGGTVSGTGKYLKEQNAAVTVVGVEPASSPVLTKGVSGAHGIQGIGANFVPENLWREVCDRIADVTDEDSFKYARLAAKCDGIAVGISSGAALKAAVDIAKLPENAGKTVVALLTDTGERYLSSNLYGEA